MLSTKMIKFRKSAQRFRDTAPKSEKKVGALVAINQAAIDSLTKEIDQAKKGKGPGKMGSQERVVLIHAADQPMADKLHKELRTILNKKGLLK